MPKDMESLGLFAILVLILCTSNTVADTRTDTCSVVNDAKDEMNVNQKSNSKCKIQVSEHMKSYFPTQLALKKPHFVQFKIQLRPKMLTKQRQNCTKDVFKPLYWSWTFSESSEPYPFISWKMDYGILSFHLLDAMTIYMKDVYLFVPDSCRLTFGTAETTRKIVEAMVPLINVSESDYPTYPESYFCYYYTSQVEKDFSRLHYLASLYLIFPIPYIGFKCSTVYWEYAQKTYNVTEQTFASQLQGLHKWKQVALFPYLVGTIILLFFPIVLFRLGAWMSHNEMISHQIHVQELLDLSCEAEDHDSGDTDWVYADGHSPLGLSDILSFHTCGLEDRFPVAVSRLRRFLFVLAAPVIIYLQCAIYHQGIGVWNNGDKITVRDLVHVGAPMGFLSIFGDKNERGNVFVPLLGGPVGVITLYYVIGTLFIALPRSFKGVIEVGIPGIIQWDNSPLCYNFSKIITLSMINVKSRQLAAGYTKAASLLKCRFYCLFSSAFWMSILKVQKSRIEFISCTSQISMFLFCCTILPVYILLCLIEILLCIIYYGLPFSGFVVLIVKGATRSVGYLRQQSRFLRFHIIVPFVFGMFIVFAYIISLMFVKSFCFVLQVLTFIFVAVIIYPSVSFGYLFFFIVLLYYFVKLIRNFGDNYEELLTIAVEVSRRLHEERNIVCVTNGHLNISNINADGLEKVCINDKQLDVSQDVLKTLKNNCAVKVKLKNNLYGIPKSLFNTLVRKHKPIHVQVVSFCFKVILVIAFVVVTFNILANSVSGPSSEISEVMHVIFIVAIGAVPKLVEVVVSHSNSAAAREIEERRIEVSIVEYWTNFQK